MKTRFLPIAILFVASVFCSCSHDDNDPVVLPVTPAANGFTWTENGAATVHTAASATMYAQYKTIIVRDAASATIMEFDLNGTNAASYAIGPDNHFTYVTPNFLASAGTVTITSNASAKATGNFHVTGPAAGGITAMDGTFTNITVVP